MITSHLRKATFYIADKHICSWGKYALHTKVLVVEPLKLKHFCNLGCVPVLYYLQVWVDLTHFRSMFPFYFPRKIESLACISSKLIKFSLEQTMAPNIQFKELNSSQYTKYFILRKVQILNVSHIISLTRWIFSAIILSLSAKKVCHTSLKNIRLQRMN